MADMDSLTAVKAGFEMDMLDNQRPLDHFSGLLDRFTPIEAMPRPEGDAEQVVHARGEEPDQIKTGMGGRRFTGKQPTGVGSPPEYEERHAGMVLEHTMGSPEGSGATARNAVIGRRPAQVKERPGGARKPGNAGGGKRPCFWVLAKEPRSRRLG
jgi:hypothetical protein